MHKFSVDIRKSVFLGCLLTSLVFFAQAARPGELADPSVRRQQVDKRVQIMRQQKAHAVGIARRKGFPVRRQVGDTIYELMRITDNRVYEFKTLNSQAAISAAVTPLFQGPYSLDGGGVTIGLWDGGAVRATHDELAGRVLSFTSEAVSGHSTHVAGTLIASGIVSSAKGMAPAARIDSYDYNSDLAQMTARAMSTPGQAGMLQLSNHSYGFVAGWDKQSTSLKWYGTWSVSGPNYESDFFGQYDDYAVDLDDLCYSAPYYLPFKAAGNDRDDTAPASGAQFQYWRNGDWRDATYNPSIHPRHDGWDNGGYDTISSDGVAKNIMVVGAVYDAVSGGQRRLTSAAFSCWGPTDDGRIKPDVVANGVGLYSSYSNYDYGYIAISGTSMATPNACGAAALLIQHYSRCFPGQYMRASTLKGLILHTADDLGNPGPDYRFGFGLINAKAAVDLISDANDWPMYDILVEDSLSPAAPVNSYAVDYAGEGPIKVTLCWTDPAGTEKTGLDNLARVLVNDLDLRLVSPDGTITWMPYILDRSYPDQPAGTGDNIRDNVEQILMPSPPQFGLYTLRVSFKGSLSGSVQHFSLAITGQSTIPQPPTANDVFVQTPMDAAAAIELDAVDDGFPKSPGRLSYTIHTLPNHGLLSDPNGLVISSVPHTIAGHGSQVSYTPRAGCGAPVSFIWSTDDGGVLPEGGPSNEATVTIEFPDGAYSPIPGDIEPDCDIDADDLLNMIDLWLGTCTDCGPSELTGDGLINLEDFTVFADYWLSEP
jgi:hypothetical protein